MATINAGTLLKEQLDKKAAERLSKLTPSAIELTRLLTSISKVDPAVIPPAVDALMKAADHYKASKPLVDLNAHRSKPGVAEGRDNIKNLIKDLSAVQADLLNLPLNVMSELYKTYNAPISKLKADLESISDAAVATQFSMNQLADKTVDHYRNVLAYEVAVVFQDILKMKPSSTSAKQLTENNTTTRGGGAYARVLEATLKAAGVTDCDVGPLITAGLRLLKDPKLPSGN
ncbi:MAG: hypothetical protein IPH35_18140 [Rhodoferax sp.]|nr:hypothetical protein [Rhodoferax sp.]